VETALNATFIVRAGIVIIAIEGVTLALSTQAFVGKRAGVVVITPVHVGLENTPALRRARVIGTRISVIALGLTRRHAHDTRAEISTGAEIAIVAGASILQIKEHTISRDHVAFSRQSAGVVIIRAGDRGAHARAVHTGIIHRAAVAIVASTPIGKGNEDASHLRIAEIHRAGILVFAIDRRSASAAPIRLADGRPVRRTGIAIVTGNTDQNLMTTMRTDALIECTGILIVAALRTGGVSLLSGVRGSCLISAQSCSQHALLSAATTTDREEEKERQVTKSVGQNPTPFQGLVYFHGDQASI